MSAAGTVPVDSKSAKKRKVKGEGAPVESGAATPSIDAMTTDAPATTNGVDALGESNFLKEIARYIFLGRCSEVHVK